MTRTVYNMTYEEFCSCLFKFKNPGEYFDIKQVQDYLLKDDSHALSYEQVFNYIKKLIKEGEVVKCRKTLTKLLDIPIDSYQIKKTNCTGNKKEKNISYDKFSGIILGWKLKSEMFTVYELKKHLDIMGIWIDYYLITEYMCGMICEKKILKYSPKRYQIIVEI